MSQTPEPLAVTRHQAAQMVNISVTEIDDERRVVVWWPASMGARF